jgi:phosphoenolpyruvate-protein kinase (PTS system EI component)
LSIGTNDLTAATLGADRFSGGRVLTHHPRVLAHIRASVLAAHEAGRQIEVCGEAASDPLLLPLLLGLDVDELSVGAARVGIVRRWVRLLSHALTAELAEEALKLTGPDAVQRALEPLAGELVSAQGGDALDVRVDGGGRLLAFGP